MSDEHEVKQPFRRKKAADPERLRRIPRNMRSTKRRKYQTDPRARVRPEHIFYFMGLLQMRFLRPVRIADLARVLGYDTRHLYLILEGKRTGSARMVRRFMRLTQFGIAVHEADFMRLPPKPVNQPEWEDILYPETGSG